MEIVDLKVKPRKADGSRTASSIRKRGGIPAILYGHGMQPLSLEVDKREFLHVLHMKAGENAVLQLKPDGVELAESTCRIRELQHNPVTDEVDHIDFTVISLTEKITVNIHIVTKNADESAGLKEGGVLDIVHHELEIECLPTAIPESIEIDLKAMKINDVIHLRDIQLPEGVTTELEPDEVLVAIHPPRLEEEAPEGEEEGATQPEVIEKGKKVEAEEGEAAAPKPKAAEGQAKKEPKKDSK